MSKSCIGNYLKDICKQNNGPDHCEDAIDCSMLSTNHLVTCNCKYNNLCTKVTQEIQVKIRANLKNNVEDCTSYQLYAYGT
jgi:hypothetical protein